MPSTEKAQELEDQMEEGVTAILDQLKEGKSENYLEYEKWASRFYNYSFGNQILIMCQNKHATYVKGYGAWKKMSPACAPKAGTGISILAPKTYTKTDEVTGEKIIGIGGFKCVTVFDIADVENAPVPPDVFQDLGDCSESLISFVKTEMGKDGITVEIVDYLGGAKGVSRGGKVEVVGDQPRVNILATLVHEWAHEYLHQNLISKGKKEEYNKLTRQQKELHAEGSTFIILHALGFDVKHSRDYLINWGNNVETFKEEMTQIQRAVKYVLGKLESYKNENELEGVA